MSGHSKWSTIKRQKGVQDAKRGQLFTKLSNAITIAVRGSGGNSDPSSNFKLRLAMDRARAANMPKDNIERAIQKAKGGQGVQVEELLYEGFGPAGVAVMIEVVTDNKQRTISEVRNILEKNGGVLGSQGSVSYLFRKRGEVVVKKNGITSEELLSKGIAANVEDMEEEGDLIFYYVDPANLSSSKQELENQGLTIDSSELVYLPSTYLEQNNEVEQKIFNLVEKLEELDDVQKVYTNLA